MAKFIIEGGRLLKGEITPDGNKNEALPALAACLLTTKKVRFERMPRIGDVLTMCDILRGLGAEADWTHDGALEICCEKVKSHQPDKTLCSKVRASILLLGPMLARMKSVELPLPGGDVIGARRVDTHFEGISALGAKLEMSTVIQGKATRLVGKELFLDEPSVTGTENIIMAACLGEGRTIIHNAACEPHVVGLCNMLNKMGAKIGGIGSNMLTIDGVLELQGCTHRISPDFMEVGSFLCLGAIAGGSIKIKDVNHADFRFILKTFNRIGIQPYSGENYFEIDGHNERRVQKDLGEKVPTIYSGPWPAYPTDLMSVAIVAATQSTGTAIFFEKMFEGRMFFTDKLMAMGATIILCDPHRVVVNGPSKLYGSKMNSPDVRAGMALLMASLVAKGKSEIDHIHQIERGYANIEQKLLSIGAALKKID